MKIEQKLLNKFNKIRINKNTIIECENYVYYLMKGIVLRCEIMPNGEEIIYNEHKQFSPINYPLKLVDNVENIFFKTKTDVIFALIPWDEFDEFLKHNAIECYEYLQDILKEYCFIAERLYYRSYGKTITNLADLLLKLSYNEYIDGYYTNYVLANMLGVHSVTISRLISKLCKEGIIVKDNKGIKIVKREILEEYI